jgi:uncharacterized OB-fold protein
MTGQDRATVTRDEMTAPWFDGLAAGRLLLPACPKGHRSRPDVLACDVCGSFDLDWVESRGRAVVVAQAADHSTSPVTRLVVVELEEGPWLVTRLDGDCDAPRGVAVCVEVVRPGVGEPYPVVVSAD